MSGSRSSAGQAWHGVAASSSCQQAPCLTRVEQEQTGSLCGPVCLSAPGPARSFPGTLRQRHKSQPQGTRGKSELSASYLGQKCGEAAHTLSKSQHCPCFLPSFLNNGVIHSKAIRTPSPSPVHVEAARRLAWSGETAKKWWPRDQEIGYLQRDGALRMVGARFLTEKRS